MLGPGAGQIARSMPRCVLRSSMDFTIIVSLMLIASGLFRLFLIRSGKLPVGFGYQQYFPYIFIVTGLVLISITLFE